MYQIDLDRYVRETSIDDQSLLLQELINLRNDQRNRDACKLFVDQIGLMPFPAFNESYYADVLNYNLGLLAAHMGHPLEAVQYMNSSNTLPSDGGDVLFSEHVSKSAILFDQKEKCKKEGFPSILIASLPKSASASVSSAFSQICQMPVYRLSIGKFQSGFALVPNWLNVFMNGGGVTHDHFEASLHNLEILNKAGVKSLFVQVRDPRSAAWSLIQMHNRQNRANPGQLPRDEAFLYFSKIYGRWIEDWINASNSENIRVNVNWITYREISRNLSDVLIGMIAELPLSERISEMFKHNLAERGDLTSLNLGAADDNAWRENTSSELAHQLWENTPDAVKFLLKLEP